MSDWISVDEQLPEEDVDVLVCEDFGYGREIEIRFWFDGEWSDVSSYQTGCITHWMPLPDPPEVDDAATE